MGSVTRISRSELPSDIRECSPDSLRRALFHMLHEFWDGKVDRRDARVACELAGKIIDSGRLDLALAQTAREHLDLADALEDHKRSSRLVGAGDE